jgi:hypothetical protein
MMPDQPADPAARRAQLEAELAALNAEPVSVADQRAAGVAAGDSVTMADQRAGADAPELPEPEPVTSAMSDHEITGFRQYLEDPGEAVPESAPAGGTPGLGRAVSNAAGPAAADDAGPGGDGDYRVRVLLHNAHGTSGGNGPGEVEAWRSEVEGLVASKYATILERV